MNITHVFFDVNDVLVNRTELGRCYSLNLGEIMAARYGLKPTAWTVAYRQILADWDSYYIDLNLNGDNGVEDMWEGVFRTTRALFRLTGAPEPDHEELIELSRELPGLASQGCDVLYDEVPDVLAALAGAGIQMGVISHSLAGQIYASLAPVLDYFALPLWGADNFGRVEKDVVRFRLSAMNVGADPKSCLMVDDKISPLLNATTAGMQAIQIRRDQRRPSHILGRVLPDLRGLVAFCIEQGEQL